VNRACAIALEPAPSLSRLCTLLRTPTDRDSNGAGFGAASSAGATFEVMSCRLADLDPREIVSGASQSGKLRHWSPADLLLQTLVGAALGFSCIYASRRHRPSVDAMLIPRLVLGYLFAVLVHEGGHAAAAVMQRFHILGFAVWPIRFYRDSSSWRVSWLPRELSKGFITIAPIGTESLRMRQFIVVAAGPLASLVTAAGCWIALGAMDAQPKWVLDQILILTLWSILFAAGGLLPIRSDTTISDGARLRLLLRGGPECDRMSAQQMIVAAALGGARPREWRSELIEVAAGPEDGSLEARFGRVLRYNWLVDQGRIDEAEQQIVWLLLEPWPEAARRAWRLQAAWFTAFLRNDAITARKWLDAGREGAASSGDYNLAMAEAALAFAEKRWTDTMRIVPQALKECERAADPGTAKAIRDALLLLMSRAELG
jgi:Peptidase M50B-like